MWSGSVKDCVECAVGEVFNMACCGVDGMI